MKLQKKKNQSRRELKNKSIKNCNDKNREKS